MITSKVDLLDRNIMISLTKDISPAAQSAAFAAFAQQTVDDAVVSDAAELGTVPIYETFVDGARGGNIANVKPDGLIVFDFDILTEIVDWIEQQLITHSPVGSGKDPHPGLYRSSHRIFVDGNEVSFSAQIPNDAQQIVFVPSVPYARVLERGWSKQAPDGIYQVVATLARQRFGRAVSISFTFQALAGDTRQPAIVLTVK